ncbi:hypothetical protein GCM10009650_01560 [Nesterenkonia jeotgali]
MTEIRRRIGVISARTVVIPDPGKDVLRAVKEWLDRKEKGSMGLPCIQKQEPVAGAGASVPHPGVHFEGLPPA